MVLSLRAWRGGKLVTFILMLGFNVATLAFAPLSAAVDAILDRVGIETMSNGYKARATRAEARFASEAEKLAATERRLAARTEELAHSRRKNGMQAEELARVNRGLDASRKELAIKSSELTKRTDDIAQLRRHVADTTQRIVTRTTSSVKRSAAALPSKAVPIIGNAIAAAATAWELKETCAMVEELLKLNALLNPTSSDTSDEHELCGIDVPTADEFITRMHSLRRSESNYLPNHVERLWRDLPEWSDLMPWNSAVENPGLSDAFVSPAH